MEVPASQNPGRRLKNPSHARPASLRVRWRTRHALRQVRGRGQGLARLRLSPVAPSAHLEHIGTDYAIGIIQACASRASPSRMDLGCMPLIGRSAFGRAATLARCFLSACSPSPVRLGYVLLRGPPWKRFLGTLGRGSALVSTSFAVSSVGGGTYASWRASGTRRRFGTGSKRPGSSRPMSGVGFQAMTQRGAEWAATGKVTLRPPSAEELPADRAATKKPK